MPLTRNQESRINEAAIVDAPRSKFDYGQDAIFSFKMGYEIPFFCECTVMPGDQFALNLNMVARLANPTIYPIMTPLYLDVYAFFVPDRLIWDHIKEFYGENPDGAWTLTTEYLKPKLIAGENGFQKGTIADYIYGCKLGVNKTVDARPIRAMNQIQNDWFRNQAVIAPYQFEHGDTDTTYDPEDSTKGGTCYRIAKYGDTFTRSLPSAIKGDEVTIPMGTAAPIYGNGKAIMITASNPTSTNGTNYLNSGNLYGIKRQDGTLDTSFSTFGSGQIPTGTVSGSLTPSTDIPSGYKGVGLIRKNQVKNAQTLYEGLDSGMYTDLSDASAAGMNQLIEAMAIYNILYRMGIGGSRYTEIIRTFWGVHASDARLQRSEYLGGFSYPIDMTEVPQVSATTEISAQGNVAAFSHTSINNKYLFNKGFVEHGTILMICAVRQRHYYSQGIERCYTTFRKFDNYMPPLANLGPMEVKKQEIFMTGNEADDNETFGFQEAWYWLRGIRPSKIMGDMRPDVENNLSAWHLADDFENAPVLSADFILETDENLKRVISVPEDNTQFIATTFVHGTVTRVMPTSSIPALRTFF